MRNFNLYLMLLLIVHCSYSQKLLFTDDFDKGIKQWRAEYNSDSTIIKAVNNSLEIVAPKGLTLWYDQKLTGNIKISYDAMVVKKNGRYDRGSDLNCFWMANDPSSPTDLFAKSVWRNGVFGKYYSLSMYYVGFGGNNNTTTRFRKYDGNYQQFVDSNKRPEIIKEYTDAEHLITPNKWCPIEIVCNDNQVSYYYNKKLLFSYNDPSPYRDGYFGLRTVTNHLKIKNFKIHQLPDENQPLENRRLQENMSRGIVAIAPSKDSVFISWRLLKSDPDTITFDIYRQSGKNKPVKLNNTPVMDGTFYIDKDVNLTVNNTWFVIDAKEKKPTFNSNNGYAILGNQQPKPYISIPIQRPAPDKVLNEEYYYSANDASVGDLDGDGHYEIILKWQPSITRNPPQKGLTGVELIDAYKLDGTRLWRINLGKNIRAGAAYTQFLVYDLDGDGKAEMVCKTADGSVDGLGNYIGNKEKDWRTLDVDSPTYGKIVDGPEYLTVFDGQTGKAVATEQYIPNRYPLDGWGGIGGNGNNDSTGGRPDRFTAAVAYLDGIKPSALFVRGWYGRTVVAAWDYNNKKLTNRWVFDSENATNPFSGQANHQVSVADVDQDGKDELCVGAMTVDDDGTGLYTTGLRHGDALSVSDMDPDRPGLEIFGIHENEGKTIALQTPGVAMYDAKTGEILFSKGPGVDVGRGVSADIDPRHLGYENWGGPGGLRDVHGNTISTKMPNSTNFVIWWDGDLTRELLDKNRIDKWDWNNEKTINLLTANDCTANNGTKATPCLSADILGDWREEVIWKSSDSSELRIYTTTTPTPYRFLTLMQDWQYRLSIVWQNVAYNQPPFTGFYLGEGMSTTQATNNPTK